MPRHEVQPRNDIRIRLEIVDLGTGQTGETVTATFRRTSDGQYLQSGGGWGASPSNLALTEPSSANQPGLYSYSVDPDELAVSDGEYVAKITNATFNILEYVAIMPTLSLADQVRQAKGSTCMRFIPSDHDSTSKQPTAGTVFLYEDAAAYDADIAPDGTGAIASEEVEATFSGGLLQVYGRKPA